jgi:hypothetical protein
MASLGERRLPGAEMSDGLLKDGAADRHHQAGFLRRAEMKPPGRTSPRPDPAAKALHRCLRARRGTRLRTHDDRRPRPGRLDGVPAGSSRSACTPTRPRCCRSDQQRMGKYAHRVEQPAPPPQLRLIRDRFDRFGARPAVQTPAVILSRQGHHISFPHRSTGPQCRGAGRPDST